jgi:hypothetical protein
MQAFCAPCCPALIQGFFSFVQNPDLNEPDYVNFIFGERAEYLNGDVPDLPEEIQFKTSSQRLAEKYYGIKL